MAQGNGDSGFYEEAKHLIKNQLVTNDFSAMERNSLRDELGISAIEADLISREEVQRRRNETKRTWNESYEEYLRNVRNSGVKGLKKAAWFDNHSGGYYIMQPLHEFEEGNYKEVSAARILASKGRHLILQNEGDGTGGVSLRVNKKTNKNTYPDGMVDRIWFEQYSTKNASNNSLKEAIDHAHIKGATIAVVYDVNNNITSEKIQKTINNYIKQYHEQSKTVMTVLVVKPHKKKGSHRINIRKSAVVEYEVKRNAD